MSEETESVRIELTQEAQDILRHVTDMPQSMMVDIAKGMDRANLWMVSRIQVERLTGVKQGPFPVEEHRLGERTGRLKNALHPSEVTIADNRAESSIGDNVKYAAIHEFGGVIHHTARTGTARLATNKHGELLRQFGFPHLAKFAKRGKPAKEVAYQAGEYDVNMPERAPVRTGIREHLQEYGVMVSAAIEESWDKMQSGGQS